MVETILHTGKPQGLAATGSPSATRLTVAFLRDTLEGIFKTYTFINSIRLNYILLYILIYPNIFYYTLCPHYSSLPLT